MKIDNKNTINKLTKENNEVKIEKEKLNNIINETTKNLNSKYKTSITELEKKLEDKESQHRSEISQLNKNSEDALAQLKLLFENEKNRLENKLKEEKSKSDTKIS